MSLQVMGNVEPGAKLVLWNVTRQPSQTWMAQMTGRLTSITYPGMVIDVKGINVLYFIYLFIFFNDSNVNCTNMISVCYH